MTRYRRHPNVVATELSGEIVALQLESKRYYTLNPTASEVWNALAEDANLPQLVTAVTRAFDVGEDEATAHVEALLEQMLEMKLVDRCDG